MNDHESTRRLYLTVPEAGARLFGAGPKRSYQLARAGIIPTVHVSERRLMVPVAAIERLAAADAERALLARGGER